MQKLLSNKTKLFFTLIFFTLVHSNIYCQKSKIRETIVEGTSNANGGKINYEAKLKYYLYNPGQGELAVKLVMTNFKILSFHYKDRAISINKSYGQASADIDGRLKLCKYEICAGDFVRISPHRFWQVTVNNYQMDYSFLEKDDVNKVVDYFNLKEDKNKKIESIYIDGNFELENISTSILGLNEYTDKIDKEEAEAKRKKEEEKKIKTLLKNGDDFNNAGDYNSATSAYQKVLNIDPKNEKAKNRLLELQKKMEEMAEVKRKKEEEEKKSNEDKLEAQRKIEEENKIEAQRKREEEEREAEIQRKRKEFEKNNIINRPNYNQMLADAKLELIKSSGADPWVIRGIESKIALYRKFALNDARANGNYATTAILEGEENDAQWNKLSNQVGNLISSIANDIRAERDRKEKEIRAKGRYYAKFPEFARKINKKNWELEDQILDNFFSPTNINKSILEQKKRILNFITLLGDKSFAYIGEKYSHNTHIVEQKIEDAYFKGHTLVINYSQKVGPARYEKGRTTSYRGKYSHEEITRYKYALKGEFICELGEGGKGMLNNISVKWDNDTAPLTGETTESILTKKEKDRYDLPLHKKGITSNNLHIPLNLPQSRFYRFLGELSATIYIKENNINYANNLQTKNNNTEKIRLSYNEQKNSWGLTNTKNETVLKVTETSIPEYYSASLYNKKGLVNKHGQIVVPFIYDRIGSFNKNGYARIIKDGKSGFINYKNEVVVPFIYETDSKTVDNFDTNGIAIVKKNDKYGLINDQNELVAPLEYSGLERINNNRFIASLKVKKYNHKYGIINNKGQKVTPFKYSSLKNAGEDLVMAKIKKENEREYYYKTGYINLNGQIVIDFIYDSGEYFGFSDGLTRVEKNDKYGFIDKYGNVVIPTKFEYDQIHDRFSNGLVGFKNSKYGKWGFMDKKMKVIVDNIYDEVNQYAGGIAKVKKGDKYGFIDIHGNIEIPLIFKALGEGYRFLGNGFESAKKLNDEKGYIDRKCNFYQIDDDNKLKLVEERLDLKHYLGTSKLDTITKIDLSNRGLSSLPKYISDINLDNITELDLSNNNFKKIPDSLFNSNQLKNLTILNLSNNKFKTIPEGVFQLNNLISFKFQYNKLEYIPEDLKKLTKLELLWFKGNKLKNIPEFIGSFSNLLQLDLMWNDIHVIPKSISNLTKLNYLYLSGNHLTSLPEGVFNLPNLWGLYLNDNNFITLSDSIGKLTSLNWLQLHNNHLTSLPSSMINLTLLKELHLYNNEKERGLVKAIKSFSKQNKNNSADQEQFNPKIFWEKK